MTTTAAGRRRTPPNRGFFLAAIAPPVSISSAVKEKLPPDNRVLEQARLSFRAYYGAATAEDATRMDTLVLCWAALQRGTSIPRQFVPPEDRDSLERACDDAERQFMRARDYVRDCPTFLNLLPADRRRIASILFDVFPPTE